MSQYEFRWSDLAFGSKKPVNDLKATFIAAPRELSTKRFTQLVKQYLPSSNIILGIATEQYIAGFDEQPQFKTLQQKDVQTIIDKVNAVSKNHKIYTLGYSQKETNYILDKLKFTQVVLLNGSWLHAFHTRPEYYTLTNKKVSFSLVSPFADETEAKEFARKHTATIALPSNAQTVEQMLELANETAKLSYDYMFQTGAAIGKKTSKGYEPVLAAYNKVVPYQTYAMHHGASRETHFSPPNDLNHYDTVHAEVELLIEAQKQGISLKDTTLFINLMPCPPCSRMLAETDITDIVYKLDHSDGYAVRMLEAAGKTVTRIA